MLKHGMTRCLHFRAAVALFPVLYHPPLFAQPSQQSAVWNVDYGERRCALVRLVRGEHSATLSVRAIPGSDSPELHFVDPARTRQPFAGVLRVDISFAPSGESLRGRGSYTQLGGQGAWVLEVNELPEQFLDRFAQATSISIRTGSRPLAEMATPRADAAVRAPAMQRCLASQLGGRSGCERRTSATAGDHWPME